MRSSVGIFVSVAQGDDVRTHWIRWIIDRFWSWKRRKIWKKVMRSSVGIFVSVAQGDDVRTHWIRWIIDRFWSWKRRKIWKNADRTSHDFFPNLPPLPAPEPVYDPADPMGPHVVALSNRDENAD